jgi:glycosyltransferase involved in cell wall biosynthesis
MTRRASRFITAFDGTVAEQIQAGTAGETPDATVVVTSKDRNGELARALESVVAQTGATVELLIIDDGSRDGTSEFVQAEFPSARLFRSEASRGLVVQRNFAAEVANAPIIFSLDDDARFGSDDTVAITLAEFADDVIGMVGIPVLDRPEMVTRQLAPSPDGRFFTFPFLGRAHAVRKEVFSQLGGYREFYLQQLEESDLSIRLYDAGYGILMGRAAAIDHFPSAVRSWERVAFFNGRNNLLYASQNLGLRRLPVFAVRRSLNVLVTSRRQGNVGAAIRGLAAGVRDSWRFRAYRDAVSDHTFCLTRDLARSPRDLTAIDLRRAKGHAA